MMNEKPSSKLFIWLFFIVPAACLVFYYIIVYSVIFRFDLQRFEGILLLFSMYIVPFVFVLIAFLYWLKYPSEMNVFLKVFLLVGLALATYLSFKYALAK
ncbi:MAG: hypothetical protein ACP5SB_05580, partial [Caldisericaceae bacterium]